jgi:hypothetical protein
MAGKCFDEEYSGGFKAAGFATSYGAHPGQIGYSSENGNELLGLGTWMSIIGVDTDATGVPWTETMALLFQVEPDGGRAFDNVYEATNGEVQFDTVNDDMDGETLIDHTPWNGEVQSDTADFDLENETLVDYEPSVE